MGARPLILLQELLDPVGDVLLCLLQLLLQPLPLCVQVALALAQALLQPGLLLQQDRQRSRVSGGTTYPPPDATGQPGALAWDAETRFPVSVPPALST